MFRNRIILTLPLVILNVILFVFAGCGGNGTGPGYNVRANLDLGWDYFSDGDYSDAIDKFTEVLQNSEDNPEAYLGRGWCYAFMRQFTNAVANFQSTLDERDDIDANMGLAAIYRDQPDYVTAISNASEVIEADSNYQFSKKTSIDYKDAHLIKAQCYYRLGSDEFPEAHIEVNYLCDDLGLNLLPDPSNLEPSEYEQALVEKIEELTDLISD